MEENQKTLFTHARVMNPTEPIEDGWLLVAGGKIVSLGSGNPPESVQVQSANRIDCKENTLLPGFIDLHTHGALGADFVFGSAEEINEICRHYAAHGVTGFLASTYAATAGEISSALRTIAACMGNEAGARILGVHLEGPWLNPERCGAQDKNKIRTAEPEEALPYLDSGLIRLVSLAPEIPQNQWLISACRDRGITVSAGHTNATFAEMQKAVELGVTQATHCFNAMSPLHHREPGAVGAALSLPEITCELIADNIHVHPAVMALLVNAKTPRGVVLITDSISAAGMPDGIYTLEGQQVICKEGTAKLADGTLAGSTLTMDAALRNLVQATGRPLEEIWCCSSLNAARSIHLEQRKGKICEGYDADLVLLDSNLHVKLTMIGGKVVFVDR